MKINKVTANQKTFKEVIFDNAFNSVVAESGEKSGAKASRNGLGKTLLVKIISYCLGSNIPSDLKADELQSWAFTVEAEIAGSVFTFARTVDESGIIRVSGPLDKLGLPSNTNGTNEYSVDNVKDVLGKTLFGLDVKLLKNKKSIPTYRGLISYFIRTDSTGFSDPFVFLARQPAWSKQVHNAYLLGLDWELAVRMTRLKTKLDDLDKANQAFADGAMNDFGGSLGELETEKINLESRLQEMQSELKKFRVHEQYYEIQHNADKDTKEIHELLNALNLNEQVIKKYSKDLTLEDSPDLDIEELYAEVSVVFPADAIKRIEDVKSFHEKITKDRKDYLKAEVSRLKRENEESKVKIAELTERKSEYMQILSSYGALDEFSLLQNEVNIQKSKVEDVKSRIARLEEVTELISRLSVEIEEMARSLRKDYSERLPSLALAITLFNENSEYLYDQPGKLSIDPTKGGYKFKVEIKRSKSTGVGSMKVFCYDLMLAEIWATIKKKPLPLIHDSKLFDGVDERQIAKALELAYQKSQDCGFQYICTLNSDQIPYKWFSEGFKEKFDRTIKVRYSDAGEDGTLLGIIF